MKCNDCLYLRINVRQIAMAELPKKFGKWVNPCNRFPMNIFRSPKEPACGEFKQK